MQPQNTPHNRYRLLAVFLLALLAPAAAQAGPSLLLNESMYDALRAQAQQAPWSDMAAAAADLAAQPYPTDPNPFYRTGDIVSAASLMYILDPANGATYRAKILAGIQSSTTWREGEAWDTQSPPGTALAHMIFALDVIRDDITPAEEAAARVILEARVNKIETGRGWPEGGYGIHAIWALYKGDMARYNENLAMYRDTVERSVTVDGVGAEGPNYSFMRFGRTRDHKYLLMHVAAFNKDRPGVTVDSDFYSDPRYVNYYEWMYGHALTPMGTAYTFGDTYPNFNPVWEGQALPPFAAGRYSDVAGGYAALRYQGTTPPPKLTSFVLAQNPILPEPMKPTSRIFRDGGAFFVEDDQVSTSLAGALWNSTQRGWHSHCDVNAVHLCAYGENILQNVGYMGAGSGYVDSTGRLWPWQYISHTASANNTVLINNTNQLVGPFVGDGGDWYNNTALDDQHPFTKRGAGITESFTGHRLDYACGNSGRVLSVASGDPMNPRLLGVHDRSMVFIHPQDGVGGYFILLDEVRVSNPTGNDKVDVYLHPNSTAYQTISANEQYSWTIDGGFRLNTSNTVKVDIALGETPASVTFPSGLLSAWGSDRWQTVGAAMRATYATDVQGTVNIPTVIYPSDLTHPVAVMERLEAAGYNGLRIAGGDVTDWVIALPLDAQGAVDVAGLTFAGRSAIFRRRADGSLAFLFARLATAAEDADSGLGFASDDPISVHLWGLEGQVITGGTTVRFFGPDVRGIELNGQPFACEVLTDGIRVDLPEGTWDVQLVPEPATSLLMLLGAGSVVARRR